MRTFQVEAARNPHSGKPWRSSFSKVTSHNMKYARQNTELLARNQTFHLQIVDNDWNLKIISTVRTRKEHFPLLMQVQQLCRDVTRFSFVLAPNTKGLMPTIDWCIIKHRGQLCWGSFKEHWVKTYSMLFRTQYIFRDQIDSVNQYLKTVKIFSHQFCSYRVEFSDAF